MKIHQWSLLLSVLMLAGAVASHAGRHPYSFGFKSSSVRGISTGEVVVSGGGVFEPLSRFVQASGNFHCRADIGQGPLAGLRAGEGVRWNAARLLPSASFQSRGSDAAKIAATGEGALVVMAYFYRDGDSAPVAATMIISQEDLDADEPGVQNVWIDGVGVGSSEVRIQP